MESIRSVTPYDELPYRSIPVEWTAPERLALASLLHGGPQQRLTGYRVLELGCGDGTNLIPMARHRPYATFLGVDGAASQIEIADEKSSALGLTNVCFFVADFRDAAQALSGQFDYIVGHGVFSWVPHDTRDALLGLCAELLRPGGLLYLNYNARPGWNVRGLVRDVLLAQTVKTHGLRARAERAREVAASMVARLDGSEHPYYQVLASEFRFVGENHLSHTAHEYLAKHNHAYWRSSFLDLMDRYGFEYVADADFNLPSGRQSETLVKQLGELSLRDGSLDDVVDLLSYRQMHSPILTQSGVGRCPADAEQLSALIMASRLVERKTADEEGVIFEHPSGQQVRVQSEVIATALGTLRPLWPRGLPLGDLFADVGEVFEDLGLLHRNGLLDLRLRN